MSGWAWLWALASLGWFALFVAECIARARMFRALGPDWEQLYAEHIQAIESGEWEIYTWERMVDQALERDYWEDTP